MATPKKALDQETVARLRALEELRMTVEELELAVRLRKAKNELSVLRSEAVAAKAAQAAP